MDPLTPKNGDYVSLIENLEKVDLARMQQEQQKALLEHNRHSSEVPPSYPKGKAAAAAGTTAKPEIKIRPKTAPNESDSGSKAFPKVGFFIIFLLLVGLVYSPDEEFSIFCLFGLVVMVVALIGNRVSKRRMAR